MLGIFQMFGISFLFWVIIGCLRFIFETLHALRESSHAASLLNLFVAVIGGVGVAQSLFLLIILSIGTPESLADAALSAFVVAGFIIWEACVILGSYLATRIYIHRPYTVAFGVGLGCLAAGVFLLALVNVRFTFTETAMTWQFFWVGTTLLGALLGGHLAYAFNALERERAARRKTDAEHYGITPDEVAVVMAAYNEELTVGATIESLCGITKPQHIYVGSDGSTDNTADVVRSHGANILDIRPNGGKAKALTATLEHFDLFDRYKAVFFVDADLKVDKDFYRYALPQFNDPDIVAIVGHAVSLWPQHFLPRWHLLFTAYRIRLWRVLQFCLRYGQTWKYTNVSPIVPGGGSIYRTSALRHIRIHVPGMVIEDFNMTFNIHHQKLGKIGFHPGSYVWDQEPYSLRDYVKQITRWYTGYFQTVRHHGLWWGWFPFATAFFTLELLVGSVFFLLTPLFLFELFMSGQTEIAPGFGLLSPITLFTVLVTIFVVDYVVTIVVALIEKKPLIILYGLGFFFLRYVEAAVFLYTMYVGLIKKPTGDGRWVSPKRVAFQK